MVRPFDLRDLTLVRRLSEHGVSLHIESALIDNLHPLRGAIMSMVMGGEFPTFVWKENGKGGSGFIQLRLAEDRHRAHILYLTPDFSAVIGEQDDEPTSQADIADCTSAWLALLDQAVAEAGRRDIHNVVAEVSETGPELPLLRRAGFAVYTRQDIWILRQEKTTNDSPSNLALSPRQPTDDWDIQLLYANTVPRLVQVVEPIPPSLLKESWVLRDGEELAAFVHIHKGPIGTWLRLFIHPNIDTDAEKILLAALDIQAARESQVVYCCVRRYESWLTSALERSGFTIWGSQAVMVKHTVHHVSKPMTDMAAVLDQQRIPVSTPMIRQYQQPESNGKDGYNTI